LTFEPDDHPVWDLSGRWHVFSIIILSVTLFMAIGLYVHSVEGQRIPVTGLYSQNVTFLEHSMIANGTVINGSAPFRSVNFPNYWFNENTRELNGNLDFPINDQLLLIFGDSLTLRGNFGAGTGNKLFGVYRLPVTADKATIYYADRYGTIGMYVDNRTVILRPGQEYTYNETETARDGNGTIHIDYQHLYTNHGTIPETSIQARMVA
jgi:hypothetical protein